jgi:tyrosinase
MIVRKNVYQLSADERKALIAGFLALKKQGTYDHYVHIHHSVMAPAVHPDEPHDGNYRNGAHRGPIFLPWHREFLMQLEGSLREVDASIALPYWDWTVDAGLPDPRQAPIWGDDLLGGDGVEADEWRVATGPFAYKNGNWAVPPYPEEDLPGPGLKRQFAQVVPTLPTPEDLSLTMREALYDTPNYNSSPFTVGFRNRLEGWITQRGDSRVKTASSQMHNRVHLWVGGNMLPMTSPDDPVFFLHHCFIDKIWADWQALQQQENPDGKPHYAPEREGPPGHNLGDALKPWTRTVAEVLDVEKLGYTYRQTDAGVRFLAAVAEVRRASRSPFLAD